MQQDLRNQYNNFSKDFSVNQLVKNHINREEAYKMIAPHLSGLDILDIGCGDGTDVAYFQNKGARAIGIDASEDLIKIARHSHPTLQFNIGYAEKLPYASNEFDSVYSKYAIMTSENLKPIFSEIHRVLKPGGVMVCLVAHPFRHYIEKKRIDANYFKKEVVSSVLFDGAVTVQEPSHNMMDYFNKNFFENFEMVDYLEAFDPTAEQINGAVYPGFMIIKARKK